MALLNRIWLCGLMVSAVLGGSLPAAAGLIWVAGDTAVDADYSDTLDSLADVLRRGDSNAVVRHYVNQMPGGTDTISALGSTALSDLTISSLSGVNLLLLGDGTSLGGNFDDLSTAQVDAIVDFVAGGGDIYLNIEIRQDYDINSVNGLLQAIGTDIRFTDRSTEVNVGTGGANSLNTGVTNAVTVTDGLESISIPSFDYRVDYMNVLTGGEAVLTNTDGETLFAVDLVGSSNNPVNPPDAPVTGMAALLLVGLGGLLARRRV